jgi:hypothetical protein
MSNRLRLSILAGCVGMAFVLGAREVHGPTTRIAWDGDHRAQYAALARCLGRRDTIAPSVRMFRLDSVPDRWKQSRMLGLHEPGRHAIYLRPDLGDGYWYILRHEWLHAILGGTDPYHRHLLWARAEVCDFAPAEGVL